MASPLNDPKLEALLAEGDCPLSGGCSRATESAALGGRPTTYVGRLKREVGSPETTAGAWIDAPGRAG